MRYPSVHHFADNTNLLNYNNSVKRMNKQVNKDFKNLTNWLNANKICLNISKIEVSLLKSSRKLKVRTHYLKKFKKKKCFFNNFISFEQIVSGNI